LSASVPNGVPAGAYRICSINTAANHQPVLVAIAQHGSLDDCVYVRCLFCTPYYSVVLIIPLQITVAVGGAAASSTTAAANNPVNTGTSNPATNTTAGNPAVNNATNTATGNPAVNNATNSTVGSPAANNATNTGNGSKTGNGKKGKVGGKRDFLGRRFASLY
jgi:hypothetical protein